MATARCEALRRLHIAPLMRIQDAIFRKQYERGLASVLFEEREVEALEEPPTPLPETFFTSSMGITSNASTPISA